jgi:cell division protein FtsB
MIALSIALIIIGVLAWDIAKRILTHLQQQKIDVNAELHQQLEQITTQHQALEDKVGKLTLGNAFVSPKR